ncbi:MAG TPA: c-type cytochrome [Steroidobacteraceae bacterium]|nr:c-type cytochrome [Steroidobacteraceae bacterium]
MSLALVACVACAAIAQAADVASQENQTKLKATIDNCSVCHGLNGHSVSPTFPNLAAQQPVYIENQLNAFKGETRGDPDAQAYMWGMASQLSAETIAELAHYFSSQPPPPAQPGDAKLIAEGREIFTKGISSEGVPPCASCHGPNAAGRGMFPRLAGQHAPYLIKQLLVIQSALRSAPVMHGIIKDLNREQMQAVTTYLASL